MNLLAFVAVALVTGAATLAEAQAPPPLAEVARAEENRRKALQTPAKVYTNDDLRPDFTRPAPPDSASQTSTPVAAGSGPHDSAPAPAARSSAAPESGQAPAAQAPAEVRDQAYWSGRITQARANLERSRTFAQALQNRVDALWTDFVNRDNPVERSAIEQDRVKAMQELERVGKDIEAETRAVAAIEEEARRANVPPGWLRP
jgi:hypothetical protein